MTTNLTIRGLPVSRADISVTGIGPSSHTAILALADILVCAGFIEAGSQLSAEALSKTGVFYAMYVAATEDRLCKDKPPIS